MKFRRSIDDLIDEETQSDEHLKSYLLPTPKSNLFNKDDLKYKELLQANFSTLIDDVLNESNQLLNDDDLQILNRFKTLTKNAQIVYLLLFFKKEKWTLIESISNLKSKELNLTKALTELAKTDFLFDHTKLNLEQALYMLDTKEIANHVKGLVKNDKSKGKLVFNTLEHCRKTDKKDLENEILNKVKKDLNGKCFKLNMNYIVAFWKVVLIKFEPVVFDKEVHSHFSVLM